MPEQVDWLSIRDLSQGYRHSADGSSTASAIMQFGACTAPVSATKREAVASSIVQLVTHTCFYLPTAWSTEPAQNRNQAGAKMHKD